MMLQRAHKSPAAYRKAGETSLLSRHFSSHEPAEQGPGESALASCQILGFKKKLNLWKNHVAKGNSEMFSLLLGLESERGYQHISSHNGNYS
jgi:hypothetical protein